MNWLKKIRNTVNCPYCGCGYTFTSEEKRQAFLASGKTEPLHPACKKAAKQEQKPNQSSH